jgi:hypothetical protein
MHLVKAVRLVRLLEREFVAGFKVIEDVRLRARFARAGSRCDALSVWSAARGRGRSRQRTSWQALTLSRTSILRRIERMRRAEGAASFATFTGGRTAAGVVVAAGPDRAQRKGKKRATSREEGSSRGRKSSSFRIGLAPQAGLEPATLRLTDASR